MPSICGLPDKTCAVIFRHAAGTRSSLAHGMRGSACSSAVGLVCSQTPSTVRNTGDSSEVPCRSAASTRPKVLRSGVCSRAPFHSS